MSFEHNSIWDCQVGKANKLGKMFIGGPMIGF